MESCRACLQRSLLESIEFIATDFDGVHTPNKALLSQNGIESVEVNRSDGLGIQNWVGKGFAFIIVSKEAVPIAAIRAKKLQVECEVNVSNKVAVLLDYASRHSVEMSRVAFLGNDVNDIPALLSVGLPVAVQDAYPEVLEAAKLTLIKPGGQGAVRELIDLISYAKNGKCYWCYSIAVARGE